MTQNVGSAMNIISHDEVEQHVAKGVVQADQRIEVGV
jgi:hypothetical protein